MAENNNMLEEEEMNKTCQTFQAEAADIHCP